MIKAICFDLDGVYFTESGKKGFHNTLTKKSGDEEKVIHVLYKSVEMHNFVKGEMSEESFWDYVRDYLSIQISNEELLEMWVKEYEIDSGVREYVLSARQSGYITCLCSNNNSARVRELSKKFGFLNDFDVAVFSYEVGVTKPSKIIFQELVLRSGVEVFEIVYADDNPDRIKGAKDLGIQTFVYEDFTSFTKQLSKLGVKIPIE